MKTTAMVAAAFLVLGVTGCGTGVGDRDVISADVTDIVADAVVPGDIADTAVNPEVVSDVEIDAVVDVVQDIPCVPDCTDITCGLDPVCYQSCGTCTDGICVSGVCSSAADDCITSIGCADSSECELNQRCNTALIPPRCQNVYCADIGSACVERNDLCATELCLHGFCHYPIECVYYQCGLDPINGASCGTCQDGYACESGACVLQADCGSRECGAGPGGIDCGRCIAGYYCKAGVCLQSEYGPD